MRRDRPRTKLGQKVCFSNFWTYPLTAVSPRYGTSNKFIHMFLGPDPNMNPYNKHFLFLLVFQFCRIHLRLLGVGLFKLCILTDGVLITQYSLDLLILLVKGSTTSCFFSSSSPLFSLCFSCSGVPSTLTILFIPYALQDTWDYEITNVLST